MGSVVRRGEAPQADLSLDFCDPELQSCLNFPDSSAPDSVGVGFKPARSGDSFDSGAVQIQRLGVDKKLLWTWFAIEVVVGVSAHEGIRYYASSALQEGLSLNERAAADETADRPLLAAGQYARAADFFEEAVRRNEWGLKQTRSPFFFPRDLATARHELREALTKSEAAYTKGEAAGDFATRLVSFQMEDYLAHAGILRRLAGLDSEKQTEYLARATALVRRAADVGFQSALSHLASLRSIEYPNRNQIALAERAVALYRGLELEDPLPLAEAEFVLARLEVRRSDRRSNALDTFGRLARQAETQVLPASALSPTQKNEWLQFRAEVYEWWIPHAEAVDQSLFSQAHQALVTLSNGERDNHKKLALVRRRVDLSHFAPRDSAGMASRRVDWQEMIGLLAIVRPQGYTEELQLYAELLLVSNPDTPPEFVSKQLKSRYVENSAYALHNRLFEELRHTGISASIALNRLIALLVHFRSDPNSSAEERTHVAHEILRLESRNRATLNMRQGDLALHYEALWAVSLELWQGGHRGDAFTRYIQEMRQVENREAQEGGTARAEFLKYLDRTFTPSLNQDTPNIHSVLERLSQQTFSTTNPHDLAWVNIEKQLISAYLACASGDQENLRKALREIEAQAQRMPLTRSQAWRATWLKAQVRAEGPGADRAAVLRRPASRAEYQEAEFLRDFHAVFGDVLKPRGVRPDMDRDAIARALETAVGTRLPDGGCQRLMSDLQGRGRNGALPDELRLVILATALEVPHEVSSEAVAQALHARFFQSGRATQGQALKERENFRLRIRELGASLFN